jgi:tRNA(Ile)-lysidine synthase
MSAIPPSASGSVSAADVVGPGGRAGEASDVAAAFGAAMAAVGPFERAPVLGVALSGGADSTCLMLLAERWARARGGDIVALTVDHGLRAGSAAEARAVARGCALRGVRHEILTWQGPRPSGAIQEKARVARHELLETWCREAGVLHLLFGHHADDQAETIAMRRARRSGGVGLSGMAMVAERRHVRLLRPLLALPAKRIRDWLTAQGVGWIEDPSNRDPRFLRGAMRQAMFVSPDPVSVPPEHGRMEIERGLARWFGSHAAVHPEGWVEWTRSAFLELPGDFAVLALRAAAMTVSGAVHPPRQDALVAASAWLRAGTGGSRDFAGCRLLRGGEAIAILRDPAGPRGQIMGAGAAETRWDRRFVLRLAPPSPVELEIVAWAAHGGAARPAPGIGAGKIAAGSLPVALRLDAGADTSHVICGRRSVALVSVPSFDVVFRPPRALAGAVFAAGSLAPERVQPTRRFLADTTMETPTAGERVAP